MKLVAFEESYLELPEVVKMKLASCEQMRRLDKTAIERYKVPGVVLMETAAISIFSVCKDLDAYKKKKVLIFCGTGNNGGDGFAIARHMQNDGALVSVALAGTPEKISGDALINYEICVNMGVEIERFDDPARIRNKLASCELIIDAILGTGVSGELKSPRVCHINC
jgi:NAD(P)H-hydrate epimerase